MENHAGIKRRSERKPVSLAARIECREDADCLWAEDSTIVDITPFGARFELPHAVDVGRLLYVTANLPPELRSYDLDAKEYHIWSLVRHCTPRQDGGEPGYQVGVAFIGKTLPNVAMGTSGRSRFTIHHSDRSVGWDILELPSRPTTETSVVQGQERRQEERYDKQIDVVVEVYDATGSVIARETTYSENISRRGMSVVTNLDIMIGRYIRIRSAEYRIAVIAAVRRLRRGLDGRNRLHLEFVDARWPPLD